MIVTPIQTHIITAKDTDITKILDKYISKFSEKTVLAVTSKIVSITQGRLIDIHSADKDKLIKQESNKFLPRNANKYNISFAITNNMLAAGAGIDESNGNDSYVLWPKKLQESANAIREYLVKRFSIRYPGVIITDSRTVPLRWGVTGTALAHSGFQALRDYIGTPDLFGRPFQFEKLNMMDSIAASAVLVMGEGSEMTPLAIVENVNGLVFQDRNPTDQELADLRISLEDDLYAPLLTSVPWQDGEQS
jgi:dihydrofolate synthase / folylpolyglutamate synthase